jgi:hypothetical protein
LAGEPRTPGLYPAPGTPPTNPPPCAGHPPGVFGQAIPPAAAFAPDPSTGKNHVFGFNIYSAPELHAGLIPPGISEAGARDLINSMTDAVAVPTTSCRSDESATDLGDLSGAIRQMMSEKGGQTGFIREDTEWSKRTRNSIRTIKSMDPLRERTHTLLHQRRVILCRQSNTCETVLKNEGWPAHQAAIWSLAGFLARIAQDSLEYYADLHVSLLVTAMQTGGWDLTKQSLEYWVRTFDEARTSQQTRLQCMCALYIVLRDGSTEHWQPRELMLQQHMKMAKQIQPSEPTTLFCTKCQTSVHGGGTCPWSNKTDAKARELGRQALIQQGEGRPGIP